MKMHLMGLEVRAGSGVILERGDRTCRGSKEVGRKVIEESPVSKVQVSVEIS